jgi:hypothetical protein
MKKVDMIKTIQLAEARAWLSLKEAQAKNGKSSELIRDIQERWMTLKCLMSALDIDSDVELAESKMALDIITNNLKLAF